MKFRKIVRKETEGEKEEGEEERKRRSGGDRGVKLSSNYSRPKKKITDRHK